MFGAFLQRASRKSAPVGATTVMPSFALDAVGVTSPPIHGEVARFMPLIIPNALSPAEVQQVVMLASVLEMGEGLVEGEKVPNSQYRQSDIGWLTYSGSTEWLFNKVRALVLQANATYQFELTGFMEPFQFGRYRAGGLFGWHHDLASDVASLRKLSMSVQLSAAHSYAGGNLCFHGATEREDVRAIGTAIFFPSFLAHAVTPVTDGERQSLVAWAHGPAFR